MNSLILFQFYKVIKNPDGYADYDNGGNLSINNQVAVFGLDFHISNTVGEIIPPCEASGNEITIPCKFDGFLIMRISEGFLRTTTLYFLARDYSWDV